MVERQGPILAIDVTRPFEAVTGRLQDGHAVFGTKASIKIDKLTLCQYWVSVPGLMRENREPIDVVHWRGRFYVHNGHHRVMRALARGQKTIAARVLWAEDG